MEEISLNTNKYNNIIYFDPNLKNLLSIYQDADFFESITPGAFISITNIDSFKLIREEIL